MWEEQTASDKREQISMKDFQRLSCILLSLNCIFHFLFLTLFLQSNCWSSCTSFRPLPTWPCPSGGSFVLSWCLLWWNGPAQSSLMMAKRSVTLTMTWPSGISLSALTWSINLTFNRYVWPSMCSTYPALFPISIAVSVAFHTNPILVLSLTLILSLFFLFLFLKLCRSFLKFHQLSLQSRANLDSVESLTCTVIPPFRHNQSAI